ncbi:hypothetical protein LTR02_009100 [Friedmanniomyces endolithicus]|nr:hypothetical protein LTR02_009100 [Friedmanniomyces endolithicus]
MAATQSDCDQEFERISSETVVATSSTIHTTLCTKFTTAADSSTKTIESTPLRGPLTLTTSCSSTSVVVVTSIPTPLSSPWITSVDATGTSTTSTTNTTSNGGPTITASRVPNTATPATKSSSTPDSTSSGLSRRSELIIIPITVIGALLIIAFLAYTILRRRKGTTIFEIIHFRQHYPNTVILSPLPREPNLTSLLIYRESRYSVRSSKHASLPSFPEFLRKTAPVPSAGVQKSSHQSPYVKTWKTTHPSPAPMTPLRECHYLIADATPPPPEAKVPEDSRITINRHRGGSHKT